MANFAENQVSVKRYRDLGDIQPQQMHLHHRFCINGTRNIAKEKTVRILEAASQSVCCETASSVKGRLNKTGTRLISLVILHGKVKIVWVLGKRELASPRNESLYWLSNGKYAAMKPYAHKQRKRQSLLKLCIFAYICIYIKW